MVLYHVIIAAFLRIILYEVYWNRTLECQECHLWSWKPITPASVNAQGQELYLCPCCEQMTF